MMKFSIIVPVYKTELYIRQCIDSVLNQNYTDYEVVLVDDGSPDKCANICDEYASRDQRIRVIHKKNGGLVCARKAGAQICHGEYIINIDSDDYILPDMLAVLDNIISRYSPDIIAYEYTRFNDKEHWIEHNNFNEGFYNGNALNDIVYNCLYDNRRRGINNGAIIFGIVVKAVRSNLYMQCQNQVPDSIRIGEDTVFTFNALLNCRNIYISKCCSYYYRMNMSSMINSYNINGFKEIKNIFQCLQNIECSDNLKNQIFVYILNRTLGYLSGVAQNCTYKEFKRMIDSEFTAQLLSIIKQACITKYNKASYIKHWCIKKERWWIYWMMYHNR